MIVCPAFATLHCGCLLLKYSQTESPRCLAQYGRQCYTTFADASCSLRTSPRMISASRGDSYSVRILPENRSDCKHIARALPMLCYNHAGQSCAALAVTSPSAQISAKPNTTRAPRTPFAQSRACIFQTCRVFRQNRLEHTGPRLTEWGRCKNGIYETCRSPRKDCTSETKAATQQNTHEKRNYNTQGASERFTKDTCCAFLNIVTHRFSPPSSCLARSGCMLCV